MIESIFLFVVGMALLLFPRFIWSITEQWKSSDATEQSSMYTWSTRFGGSICTILGVLGLIFIR